MPRVTEHTKKQDAITEDMIEAIMSMVTTDELRVAQRLNPYYVNRFGHQPWADADSWTALFAYRIATVQNGAGLIVDGVFGPKTRASMGTHKMAAPVDYLLIGGEKVRVPFPVVDWRDKGGMSFYDFPSSWRATDREPDMFVLHWDVCPSSQSCFQVLVQRGLSVHLMMDADGVVYQALDLLGCAAAHAYSKEVEGSENERSIGIEINNPVLPGNYGVMDTEIDGRTILRDQPKANSDETWTLLDYTDIQKQRVVHLCEAVCDALKIPKSIPSASGLLGAPPVGVVGHYHLNSGKIDPGFTLWPALEAAGFDRV